MSKTAVSYGNFIKKLSNCFQSNRIISNVSHNALAYIFPKSFPALGTACLFLSFLPPYNSIRDQAWDLVYIKQTFYY